MTIMTKLDNVRKYLWIALIAVGITFMIVGILHGELTAIMRKATVICLECIGIG